MMPEAYDRGRKPPEGVLEMWIDRIASALGRREVNAIVDLGCGTGRFTGALADAFSATVVGVDPSEKMLAQAKAKPMPDGVRFARGSGESIPCGDQTADLIFASMSFHHFAAPDQVARECRRVLRNGGVVCIRNSTRENGSPYELYFPNYRAALATLPKSDEIITAFPGCGFGLRHRATVPHTMAKTLHDLAEKAAYRADTTLLRLSDADFEHGLVNMRAAAKRQNAPVMIPIELFAFLKTPESGEFS
jgi:ubiquinone/menaquinone biosynthesis C-methylase UbiE